jgi:hypothetical protein
MARFFEEKISCQKLEKITLADGRIVDGYESRLCVSVDRMLHGIQNDRQLNGRVQEYEASFTVNNNELFGLKNISVKNAANPGMESTDEYNAGDEHVVHVKVDDNEVTMTVQNPGGSLKLEVTYTIFSKLPIERADVEIDANANYQVAQDYGQRNDTPNGVVEISNDDDMISESWYMKKHVDHFIHALLQRDDQMETLVDAHGQESNVAGRLYGHFKPKEGADPKSIVRNMANFIDIKIKLEELSDDNVYVIVECKKLLNTINCETFITTMSDSETLQDVKNKIMPMIHDRMNGQNLNDCTVKNLSTGKLLRDETVCKDISNGQKNRNFFIAPRPNIKWISIESQANTEA